MTGGHAGNGGGANLGGLAGAGGDGGAGLSNSGVIQQLIINGQLLGGAAGNGGNTNLGGVAGNGGASGAGLANAGTLQEITINGTIQSGAWGANGTSGMGGAPGSGGAVNTAILNTGSIGTLNNYGVISNSGSIYPAISNTGPGTIAVLVNGQSGLSFGGGATPGTYYTYFSAPNTFGTLSFVVLWQYSLSAYGLRIAQGQNYAVGTYSNVITADNAFTIGSLLPVSGVTYHLEDGSGTPWASNLSSASWTLVIDSVLTNRVWAATAAQGNRQGLEAAAVIDGSDTLSEFFESLSTDAQISDAVRSSQPALSGSGVLAQQDVIGEVAGLVGQRLDGVRAGNAGDGFFSDQYLWLKPFGSRANQDAHDGVEGYDGESYGLVLGSDGQLNADWRVGAAFAYANTRLDAAGADHQDEQIDTYQLIGYGSQQLDARTALNLQLDVGQGRHDTQRQIAFAQRSASADFDSRMAHAGASLERRYALDQATAITPALRLDYSRVDQDSYREHGASELDLSVNSLRSEALVLGLGATLARALDPYTRLEASLGVGYDAINDGVSLSSSFAGAPGAEFQTPGLHPSAWQQQAGLALVRQVREGLEVAARYDLETRSQYDQQTLSLKLNWLF